MKKILVIDDDPSVVGLLEKTLSTSGYEVLTSYNGHEGLSKFNASKPDLVIIDVMMPAMDGFSTIKEIRSQDGADVPCIVLTAKPELNELFRMEGARAFFEKPFKMDQLLSKVRELTS